MPAVPLKFYWKRGIGSPDQSNRKHTLGVFAKKKSCWIQQAPHLVSSHLSEAYMGDVETKRMGLLKQMHSDKCFWFKYLYNELKKEKDKAKHPMQSLI